MKKATPAEVMKALSDDLKFRGETNEMIAERLGYKHKNSIANIFSAKKYLSEKLAGKFCREYNYNKDFLTKGEGELDGDYENNGKELVTETDILYEAKLYSSEEGMLKVVAEKMEQISDLFDDPVLSKILKRITPFLSSDDPDYEYVFGDVKMNFATEKAYEWMHIEYLIEKLAKTHKKERGRVVPAKKKDLADVVKSVGTFDDRMKYVDHWWFSDIVDVLNWNFDIGVLFSAIYLFIYPKQFYVANEMPEDEYEINSPYGEGLTSTDISRVYMKGNMDIAFQRFKEQMEQKREKEKKK